MRCPNSSPIFLALQHVYTLQQGEYFLFRDLPYGLGRFHQTKRRRDVVLQANVGLTEVVKDSGLDQTRGFVVDFFVLRNGQTLGQVGPGLLEAFLIQRVGYQLQNCGRVFDRVEVTRYQLECVYRVRRSVQIQTALRVVLQFHDPRLINQ